MEEKSIQRQYREAGLVYYTPAEECVNTVTHALGSLAAVVLLAFMLLRATRPLSILAAVVSCTLLALQFAISAAYHGTRRIPTKALLRRLDYPAVSLNVLSCGTMFSLLYGQIYGYVAWALSVCIVGVVLLLCCLDFARFKAVGVIAAFVVGALMFGSFLSVHLGPGVTHKYPVVWYHLAGLLCSLAGAAFFGIHRPFVHSVFHVFVLVGPILCTVGNLLQLN